MGSSARSRPTRRQLGTYVFLVDVQGHRSEPALAEALEQIAHEALWLRVFGSYPRWQGGPRLAPPPED